MRFKSTTALATAGILAGGVAFAAGDDGPFGFGEVATQQEIAAIDIDVMPDGRGLPPGSGSVSDGKALARGTLEAAANFLALGLDPEKSTFWVQSDLPSANSHMSIVFQVKRRLLFRAIRS